MDYWMKIGIATVMIILISVSAAGESANRTITCSKPINGSLCGDKVCPGKCEDEDTCPCTDGYTQTNKTVFTRTIYVCDDIQECIKKTHNCGANSQCKNTVGAYYCSCIPGFRRGNVTEFCPSQNKSENVCSDIDECMEKPGICGPNSECDNKYSSYSCRCLSNYMNISNKCTVRCRTDNFQPTCNVTQCNLDNFEKMFTPSCNGNQGNFTLKQFFKKLSHLFLGVLKHKGKERLQKSGLLLNKVELIVQNLAPLLQNISEGNRENYIYVKVINNSSSNDEILLKGANTFVKLDAKMALGNSNRTVVGSLEYSNISEHLSGASLTNNANDTELPVKLVSPVVSVFIGNSDTSNLSHPVELHINFTEKVKEDKTLCAFWSTNQSSWSTSGCVTQQRYAHGIVCTCTHLTSFAVLMAQGHIKSWTLDLITRIGLSISIICLFFCHYYFLFLSFLAWHREYKKNKKHNPHTPLY